MSAQETNIQKQTGNSIHMLGTMVGLGVLCALLIVLTFQGTMPAIEKNKAEALEKAIYKVIPGISAKAAFEFDVEKGFSEQSGDTELPLVYAGYDDDGKLIGLAIEGSGMGFADQLKVLYGYDPFIQAIVGFYVLESKETPGLGDKIEKDANFLANFDALDVQLDPEKGTLKNKIVTVKHGKKQNAWEIDGITGATISSRAIGDLLANSSEKWIATIHGSLDNFKEHTNRKESENE